MAGMGKCLRVFRFELWAIVDHFFDYIHHTGMRQTFQYSSQRSMMRDRFG